jgi:putative FmdB family regulatory protein
MDQEGAKIMPLYEYQCQECDGRFDRLVRSTGAAASVTCDRCESPNVRRLVSSFASFVGGMDDPVTPRAASGGGCCGGSCGCGH